MSSSTDILVLYVFVYIQNRAKAEKRQTAHRDDRKKCPPRTRTGDRQGERDGSVIETGVLLTGCELRTAEAAAAATVTAAAQTSLTIARWAS